MSSSGVYNDDVEIQLPPQFEVEGDDGQLLKFYLTDDGEVIATSSEGPYEVTDFWVTSRVLSTRRGRECVRIRWFTPDMIAFETGEVIERDTPCNGWAFLDTEQIILPADSDGPFWNRTLVISVIIWLVCMVLPLLALVIGALLWLKSNPTMV